MLCRIYFYYIFIIYFLYCIWYIGRFWQLFVNNFFVVTDTQKKSFVHNILKLWKVLIMSLSNLCLLPRIHLFGQHTLASPNVCPSIVGTMFKASCIVCLILFLVFPCFETCSSPASPVFSLVRLCFLPLFFAFISMCFLCRLPVF